MSIKFNKVVFFILAFSITTALYLPAMSGSPIWDDFSYWFNDPVMKSKFSYLKIWINYAWPLSVSLQKFLLIFFKKNYVYYHVLNLFLHFFNSFLVYKLGKLIRLKNTFIYFLLFLLHPAAVITTGWMIQIKTLVCFAFAIGSLIAFIKGNHNIKWMFLSWLFFAGSILSKSASITLPLVFFLISVVRYKYIKLHLLIPFLLISSWGSYRVLKSSVTIEGAQKAFRTLKIKEEPKKVVESPKPQVVESPKPQVVESPKPQIIESPKPQVVESPKPQIVESPKPQVKALPEQKSKVVILQKDTAFKFLSIDWSLLGQTINYYFWQAILPVHNPPVRGINIQKAGVLEIVHIIFILCFFLVFKKDQILIYLVSAYVMLLPFLGFIPAPFMNVTWVSDQHLYLALPAFLGFWVSLFNKIRWSKKFFISSFLILFFGLKTFETSPTYKNQFIFFEKSLEYNPYNIPIAYNLALAKIVNGEINLAYTLLSETYYLSEQEPLLKKNIFYPHFEELHLQVKSKLEKK